MEQTHRPNATVFWPIHLFLNEHKQNPIIMEWIFAECVIRYLPTAWIKHKKYNPRSSNTTITINNFFYSVCNERSFFYSIPNRLCFYSEFFSVNTIFFYHFDLVIATFETLLFLHTAHQNENQKKKNYYENQSTK